MSILNPAFKIASEDNKNIIRRVNLFSLHVKGSSREQFEKEYLITQLKKHHGNIFQKQLIL